MSLPRDSAPGQGAASAASESLTSYLRFLHQRLAEIAPDIDRLAVALYDPADDMLRSFINSTPRGYVIRGYQYPLANSQSLSHIARTGEPRLIENIPAEIKPDTTHSKYLLDAGFRSSYTLRLSANGQLLGLLFFDSLRAGVFTAEVQRELQLYGQMVAEALGGEIVAARALRRAVTAAWATTCLGEVETPTHLARLGELSQIIALALMQSLDLDDEFVAALHLAAPLHDIGKIGLPEELLLKSTTLDEGEWELVRAHVLKGLQMIDAIIDDLDIEPLKSQDVLRNVIGLHHEYLDGSGYPHGLSGADIPLEARIVTVADMFDTMISERPYKQPIPVAQALAELHGQAAAGKIDGRCVQALEDNLDQVMALLAREPNSEA
ncbi:MAG: HD domain-containing phosphohydrolase [Candidatus Nanopelagicales bacterium]